MTTAMTQREADERRDAVRLLLQHPLVTAEGRYAEGFALVRRHRDALARDVRQLFGYRLVVETSFARLYKAGLGAEGARPLRRASGSPFSPRAYSYLSLCCAVLLTGRQQVLLSWLVEEVRQAATEAGLQWGDDTLAARRDLAAALRHLVGFGVIVEDDGSVSSLADDADAEALLFVRRDLVRHLLAVPMREVDTPEVLVELAAQPAMSAGPRHLVRRLLVEQPAVLVGDVDDESWAWLRQSQRREATILGDAIGLDLEIRAEGVIAIDPTDELTDVEFPRGGSLGHAALLALAELVGMCRPDHTDTPTAWVTVPPGSLPTIVEELLTRHGSRWRNDYVEQPARLVADVEELLVAMRLLRQRDGEFELSAVACRYAPDLVDAPARHPAPELDLRR
jgi:uncharacterized protein (TIGR02678 family)